jgi:hypothetical protein
MAWILAAIAVMAVLGLLVVTHSEPNTERQQEYHQPQPAKQDDATQPQAHGDAQHEAESGASENKQHNYWERFVSYVEAREKFFTTLGTMIIAAFTVFLCLATAYLYFATRNLVEGADDTAQKQLRAYIGTYGMETTMYPFEKGGYAFIAHVELRNFGQTPAYDLIMEANAAIDVPTADPFDQANTHQTAAGPNIAFRDAGVHVNVGWPISEEDKNAVRDRVKNVFVWGTVRYRDVFNKRHYFTFRLINGQIAVGSSGVYVMAVHPKGNDAD